MGLDLESYKSLLQGLPENAVGFLEEIMCHIEKLEKEQELFRITQSFTNDMIFRVDMKKSTVHFIGKTFTGEDVEFEVHEFIHYMINEKKIYKDDLTKFMDYMEDMMMGKEQEATFRLNDDNGGCAWYAIEYIYIRNEHGEIKEVVGKIVNIQYDKDLEDKASLDLLTGCMNKGTFDMRMTAILDEHKSNEAYAFMMIDIDDFKGINDSLGHYFGDIVLKEVASKLKRTFRDSDYIARIGGDEFGVLMKNVPSIDTVIMKAEEVVKILENTYQSDSGRHRISGSVGIALYPRDADNYMEIYKSADMALYHSKNQGKNKYSFYNPEFKMGIIENKTPFDIDDRVLSYYFNQEIAMDVFNLLFESTDYEEAINIVLEHLGEYFNVDRCYIFESNDMDEEKRVYANTFEWCREGITFQKESLQNISLEEFEEFFIRANKEGIFYCNDTEDIQSEYIRTVLADQGIVSLLHAYVKKQGKVQYVLGFDDCTANRVWNVTEISTLMYACKIIAQFMEYRRLLRSCMQSQRKDTYEDE